MKKLLMKWLGYVGFFTVGLVGIQAFSHANETEIPNFSSEQACVQYITSSIIGKKVSNTSDYFPWFWNFKMLKPSTHTDGAVTRKFYAGEPPHVLTPAAGGCQFVNTVFWPEMKAQLQQELAIVESKGTSLPSYKYGAVCQGNAPAANLSGCSLEKALQP